MSRSPPPPPPWNKLALHCVFLSFLLFSLAFDLNHRNSVKHTFVDSASNSNSEVGKWHSPNLSRRTIWFVSLKAILRCALRLLNCRA